MKLSTIQTVTVVPAQAAQTVQADTITTKWNDNESSVKAELTFSNSTVTTPSISRRMTITLWDSTTTPSYATIGDWTESAAQARVLTVLGLTA